MVPTSNGFYTAQVAIAGLPSPTAPTGNVTSSVQTATPIAVVAKVQVSKPALNTTDPQEIYITLVAGASAAVTLVSECHMGEMAEDGSLGIACDAVITTQVMASSCTQIPTTDARQGSGAQDLHAEDFAASLFVAGALLGLL